MLSVPFASFYLADKLPGSAVSPEANMTETLISFNNKIYWINPLTTQDCFITYHTIIDTRRVIYL